MLVRKTFLTLGLLATLTTHPVTVSSQEKLIPDPITCAERLEAQDPVFRTDLSISCFQIAVDVCGKQMDSANCIEKFNASFEDFLTKNLPKLTLIDPTKSFSDRLRNRSIQELQSRQINATCDGQENSSICLYRNRASAIIEYFEIVHKN